MIFEGGKGAAGLMLISATMTYDVISATNSSPQTTEINAAARADTLMKWVKIGLVQAAALGAAGAIMAYAAGEPWWAVVVGATGAGILLWLQYVHALNSGMEKPGPPTERYG